ncbi:MAG: DUF4440 domain-containing protein [Candidatus Acidiferrales bacterium]
MSVLAARKSESPIDVCSRRTAMASLGIGTALAATFSRVAAGAAAPQASNLAILAKLREDWVRDLRTKQLEPILKFYAVDAVFLQPNGDRISGAAALRNFFQMILTTFDSDLTLHSQKLDASGDLAYDSGDFEETLTTVASGAKMNSKGSYIVIYKRQPADRWEIVQHVWTGILPAGT